MWTLFYSKYDLTPQPEIIELFNNFEVNLTDDDLWKMSNEIRPSQRYLQAQSNMYNNARLKDP